jgi:hypothetical protein
VPTLAATLRLPASADPEARLQALLDAGFERLGLEPPFYEHQEGATLACAPRGAFVAVRLFLPFPRAVHPGMPCPFRLGSPQREDERDALLQGSRTLAFADRHAIPTVLLPATPREEAGQRPLSSLLRTLDGLLSLAGRYALRLALSPGRPGELPSPEEAEACFREFRGGPLALWPDPACEREARWCSLWSRFSAALAGVTLRAPADEIESGAAAGQWKAYRSVLEQSPVWLLDLPEAAPPALARRGAEILEALLEGPARGPQSYGDFGIVSGA